MVRLDKDDGGSGVGMFSDLLVGLTITVKSPDGNITLEIEDGRNVIMEFAPGSYRRYEERELERQLAGLLSAMWSAHRQAHLMVLSERVGTQVSGGNSHSDRRTREFVEERDRVRTQGRSTSGSLELTTTGLTQWQVRIRAGTVRTLDEEAFLMEVWGAFSEVMRDHRSAVAKLKRDMLLAPQQ